MKPVQDMPDRASKVGHQMFDFTNRAAMEGLLRGSSGPADGLFIGAMGVLGAAVSTAGLIAKRIEGVDGQSSASDKTKAIVAMTNPETVLFVALVAARMFTQTEVDRDGESFSTRSEFSPEAIHLAIEDWKKLTGKDPADYLHNGMIKADREKFDGSDEKLLEDFLAKRPGAYVSPSSDATQ